MSTFLLSQILVGIAVVFDAAAFQFKDRGKIFVCFLFSSGLISAHFLLLGQDIGAAVYFLTFLRFLAGYVAKSRYWLLIFLLATTVVSIVTYQSPVSALAFCGGVFSTVGAFQRDDLRLRGYMLAGTSLWLVFNLVVFSPVAVVRQSVFIVSNVVGLMRHYGRLTCLGKGMVGCRFVKRDDT